MVKELPKIKASRGKSRVRASFGGWGMGGGWEGKSQNKGIKSYERNLCLGQLFIQFFSLYLTLNS